MSNIQDVNIFIDPRVTRRVTAPALLPDLTALTDESHLVQLEIARWASRTPELIVSFDTSIPNAHTRHVTGIKNLDDAMPILLPPYKLVIEGGSQFTVSGNVLRMTLPIVTFAYGAKGCIRFKPTELAINVRFGKKGIVTVRMKKPRLAL